MTADTRLRNAVEAVRRRLLQGAKFVGAYTEAFNVKGSFPNKPFPEAIKFLSADGQLRVDLADAAGLTIEKLTLPISLRDGKAVIAFADKPKDQRFPPPATCNGGTLNLHGFYIDLASPDEPRGTLKFIVCGCWETMIGWR